MNYLAHVFLSHETPDAVTGALLGDFVKGRAPERWGAAVRHAILLHRAIDRYTDGHAVVCASRALISPERRRFAGILVDIFYDHFLARHWSRFCAQPLTNFTGDIYRLLLPRRASLPERLRHILPYMAADDWLASYAEVSAVDAALNGMTRRFRNPPRAQPLASGAVELALHYPRFEAQFLEFFPQVQDFVATQPAPLPTPMAGAA